MEKNIELNIGKRFKKRKMSREAANNRLKMRIERQYPDAWQGWWERKVA